MKDRLSFRTGEVSPFSQILLESVKDYSGTTRYAIDLLGGAFHPVLLIAHKSGVTLFDSLDAVCRLADSKIDLPEPAPQASWSFSFRFGPSGTIPALPAPDPSPLRVPLAQPRSRPEPLSAELRNTIAAGIDQGKPSVHREASVPATTTPRQVDAEGPVQPKETAQPQKNSDTPRRGLSQNLLNTIGAGIDWDPPQPHRSLDEILDTIPAEERARLAALQIDTRSRKSTSTP